MRYDLAIVQKSAMVDIYTCIYIHIIYTEWIHEYKKLRFFPPVKPEEQFPSHLYENLYCYSTTFWDQFIIENEHVMLPYCSLSTYMSCVMYYSSSYCHINTKNTTLQKHKKWNAHNTKKNARYLINDNKKYSGLAKNTAHITQKMQGITVTTTKMQGTTGTVCVCVLKCNNTKTQHSYRERSVFTLRNLLKIRVMYRNFNFTDID